VIVAAVVREDVEDVGPPNACAVTPDVFVAGDLEGASRMSFACCCMNCSM